MRVISESTIIDSMQYMHLGYVSAFGTPAPATLKDQSFVVAGELVMLTGAVLSFALWRRSLKLSIVGVVIFTLGFLMYHFAPLHILPYENPQAVAFLSVSGLHELLVGHGGPTPGSMRGCFLDVHKFQKDWSFHPWTIQDPWHRDLRVKKVSTPDRATSEALLKERAGNDRSIHLTEDDLEPHKEYVVESAGQDGRWDTDDDLRYGGRSSVYTNVDQEGHYIKAIKP